MLDKIVHLLYTGYTEIIVILLFLAFVFRKHRKLWSEVFLLSNCILLCTSTLYIGIYLSELFTAWYAQVPQEQEAFVWRIAGPYWYTYWIMIFAQVLAPLLFCIKRSRKSILASLIMILILNCGSIIELLISYSARRYQDHRPAAWSYYQPPAIECLIPFFTFGTLLMVVYLVRRNIGKGRRVSSSGHL